MNFDTDLASSLRTAIQDTTTRLLPPIMGGRLDPSTREALEEHLDYLLQQERFLFTGMVVIDEPVMPAAETPWYPPGYTWIVLGDSCNTCPVPRHQVVYTLARSEQVGKRFCDKEMPAGSFDWARDVTNPIVAYALVVEPV